MAGDKVGTGYVPIKPDTEGFGSELEKGLDKEGTPAATRSGDKMAKAAAGAFAAGVALIGKSVMDFGGFEKQMNEVFTLLPGISGDAMDAMTQQVKDFSVEFGVLPQEVVPALYQSLSAGVPQDNVFAFIETAQKLAKGGVTDLTTAVDGLSSVVNAYGSDVLSAEQASDLMFTTVKLGKTNIAELSSSLFQVTPTAAGLGVAFGDVTAALAAMTLQGVPTSVATTQLRQLFVELSKEGSAAAGTFQELSGKSFRDFIAAGGNVQEALQVMEKGAADTGVSISDMFGSVEAGSAALALTGGGTEAFSNALAGMDESAGATEKAFDQMNQGLGATLDKLKAKFSVTLLNIGEQIAPTVGAIGEAFGMLLEVFSKIPGPMQAVIVLLGTTAAGLFAFAKPIMNGIALFQKLGGVFSMLAANPWVLVVAGLVAITFLIIKNWDKVKGALVAVFGAIGSAAKTAWGGIVTGAKAAWGAIEAAGSAIASAASAVWGAITAAASGTWNAITAAAGAVRDFVVGVWNAITGAASATWTAITTAAGAVRDFIVGIWNTISSTASATWGAITGAVSGTISTIVGLVTGIPSAISSAFGTLADVISAPFRAAFSGIKTAWNSTVGGFGFKTPDWIPVLGGKSFTIPSMAAGGVLTAPTLALAGEYPGAATNPEIVTPQNIMRETMIDAIASTGGGAGPALQVNGPLIGSATIRDDRDIVELSRELAREVERRSRGAGKRLGGVNTL